MIRTTLAALGSGLLVVVACAGLATGAASAQVPDFGVMKEPVAKSQKPAVSDSGKPGKDKPGSSAGKGKDKPGSPAGKGKDKPGSPAGKGKDKPGSPAGKGKSGSSGMGAEIEGGKDSCQGDSGGPISAIGEGC
ncbi:hypothetical protein [Nocardia sp. NPDC050175]|uniref:hypothetical protein n=1 Tax=Nocardia sp. NPDC050175 TaxID=3364317 RepID=UPI003788654E